MPQDQQISFVLAGLLALNDNWDQARQLFSELASAETEQPDIWAFSAALEAGHLDDLLAILEATSAKDLWRPLYEALCAVRAGSAQYLRRVAPEIRPVAQAILDELAPGLPG
jgi:hypothetical protein